MSGSIKEIELWLSKGDHDLGTAKITYLHIPEYLDTVTFHCQQAVEKYLKAILVYYEIDFQRTHNLIYLLELLAKKIEFEEDRFDKAILLNGFSVQIRYPDKTIFLSNQELETAIAISEEFRSYACGIIGIK